MWTYVLVVTIFSACSASEIYRCPVELPRDGKLGTFGASCYQYVHTHLSWHNARSNCQSKGGDLVVLKNSGTTGENTFVANLINGQPNPPANVWIGLHDTAKEGHHKWVDGSDLSGSDTSFWASGEPTFCFSGPACSEDCAYLTPGTAKWGDYICGTAKTFVCEYDLGPTTTSTTTTTTTTTPPTTTTAPPTTTTAPPTTTTMPPTTTTMRPTTTTAQPTTTTEPATTTTTTKAPPTTTTTPPTTTTTPLPTTTTAPATTTTTTPLPTTTTAPPTTTTTTAPPTTTTAPPTTTTPPPTTTTTTPLPSTTTAPPTTTTTTAPPTTTTAPPTTTTMPHTTTTTIPTTTTKPSTTTVTTKRPTTTTTAPPTTTTTRPTTTTPTFTTTPKSTTTEAGGAGVVAQQKSTDGITETAWIGVIVAIILIIVLAIIAFAVVYKNRINNKKKKENKDHFVVRFDNTGYTGILMNGGTDPPPNNRVSGLYDLIAEGNRKLDGTGGVANAQLNPAYDNSDGSNPYNTLAKTNNTENPYNTMEGEHVNNPIYHNPGIGGAEASCYDTIPADKLMDSDDEDNIPFDETKLNEPDYLTPKSASKLDTFVYDNTRKKSDNVYTELPRSPQNKENEDNLLNSSAEELLKSFRNGELSKPPLTYSNNLFDDDDDKDKESHS